MGVGVLRTQGEVAPVSHLACLGEGSGVVDGMSRYLVLLPVLAVFHQQFSFDIFGKNGNAHCSNCIPPF